MGQYKPLHVTGSTILTVPFPHSCALSSDMRLLMRMIY